ncbi:hypothetical protein NM208_g59 [Fusarium decemcellulare]|uniref:Uncharacterized protein n=1 Tax=Fusarium decemcellulare TaxID=57161 RepID=A0ACC1T0W1_9HYPO|nr:hypothetical protein NM208_g59 [Fusarium decemcellulare]
MAVNVDRVISSVTLAGSLLSSFATLAVLVSFAIYRRHVRNFRHVLVLNLMMAEFSNALNNSVSGIIFLLTGDLHAGVPCVVNALIGQLSVQAADFSILAIALVTLLTVTRVVYMPSVSTAKKVLICASIWIVPVTTSLIPTFMGEMKPVGGNWCWISSGRSDLRYALTHGWRFFVIFATLAIYAYIWAYLRRHLRSSRRASHRSSYNLTTLTNTNSFLSYCSKRVGFRPMKDEEAELDAIEPAPPRHIAPGSQRESPWVDERGRNITEDSVESMDIETTAKSATSHSQANGRSTRHRSASTRKEMDLPALESTSLDPHQPGPHVSSQAQSNTLQTNISEFPIRRDTHDVELEIKRMMLLNAYPFMYVLLWMPGLVNRLMEASGHAPSKTTIAALQTSTQFIGFANAVTYGFNHHLRDRLKGMYLTPMISRVKRRLGR